MRKHLNLFVKMMLLFVSVIFITLLLYGRSYQNDVKVITQQVTASDLSHLKFFVQQLDGNIDQLATAAYTLLRDPTVRDYEQIGRLDHLIDRNQTIRNVLEKLSLQAVTSNLENTITVYNVQEKEYLSSDSGSRFDVSQLSSPLSNGWTYAAQTGQRASEGEFRMLLSDPADYASSPQSANMIMEIRFPVSNLQKLLGDIQSPYGGFTFLYRPGTGLIHPPGTDSNVVQGLVSSLGTLSSQKNDYSILKYKDKRYLVSTVRSSSLGWQVIHCSPLEQMLKPLESSRGYFFTASLVLLGLGILFSLLLFRQIQRPINALLRVVNRLKEGDWSSRIRLKTNNEFSLLNESFNDMAAQIQSLIERVYMEQLRAKDAYLKQLQSQINPHFLYNCLFFIKSKAGVGDTAAVTAMALNLGEYYRYITRLDHTMTTVAEELKLLESYLSIQNLRKQRIDYRIEAPQTVLGVAIPRLLIQPLVENAIVHGIEKKAGAGYIGITGEINGDDLEITVEDSGAGMSDNDIAELLAKLNEPERGEVSCGLWNVQQRLKHQFGPRSGLSIQPSELGGIRVKLRIHKKEG
ncbi:sensor histidine kinase [Cohnella sp. CFH 77786]|uniref:cache domain-containing sensor histidine kinase n=1 Tax=Cohnella sp. CFH 77786 TaxID=2662265 RepID=UPI001C60B0F6|nr:histidine kinase [Cohnella sp. CFH 77786]